MPFVPVIPAGLPPPLAPYSPGARAGDTLFVSGMLAMNGDGSTAAVGDTAGQTRIVLDAIKAVVTEAGGTMKDIVYNMIFLKNLDDYAVMNAVYREYFPSDFPARFCVRTDLVRADFLVEISSIAHLKR